METSAKLRQPQHDLSWTRGRKLDRRTERFFEAYDDCARRVIYARSEDFTRYLRMWFACFDDAPLLILNEVNRLQSLSDWEDVEKNVVREPGSFVGSGELNWPDRSEDRLSNQLATLRELANGNLVPHDFAFNYFYSGDNNIDRTVQEMAANLFEPHAEELRRRLYNLAEDAAELAEAAPASDRMVALDHNSAQFTQAIERLGEVQVKLRENNQIDPDDKARIQVEIVSGIEILKAPKTRVEAAKVMLLGALGWLALEFASSGLGMAAEAAYRAVSTLLGF